MTTLQRWKQEARRAEQRSDWRRAIELYREAARLDDQGGAHADLSLWNRIGDLHVRLGETQLAVECYERAADRYASNDLPTSAIALCNKILRLAPDRERVYRRLALLHAASGLRAEGRAACLRFAAGRVAAGDLGEALEAVQEFVDLTGDARIRLDLAEILEREGEPDQALAQRRLAGEEQSKAGIVPIAVEKRLASLDGEREAATGDLPVTGNLPVTDDRPAAQGPPAMHRPTARLDALVLDALAASGAHVPLEPPGRPEDAKMECRDATFADPLVSRFLDLLAPHLREAGPQAHFDLGVALHALGLLPEAAAQFQRGMDAPRRLRSAAARLQACLGESGPGREEGRGGPAPAGGSSDPEAAAAEAPDVPGVRILPESRAEEIEVPDPAEPPADEGETPGRPPEPRDEVGALLFRARLARHRIRRATEAGEVDHEAHLELAEAYGEIGLPEEGAQELRRAVEGGRRVAERALDLLARHAGVTLSDPLLVGGVLDAARAAGHAEAADRVERALAEAPDGPAFVADVRPERAPAAPPADPGEDELLAELERLERERRLDEAIDVVDRILVKRPDDVVLHHQRAELARSLGDTARLVASYLALAESLLRRGAVRTATTVYERVREIDPLDPRATAELARIRGPGAAGPDTRELDPSSAVSSDPEAHFELGIAFRQMGMWSEALEELERSLPGLEDPLPAWEAIGECLASSGREREALEVLRKAAGIEAGDGPTRLGVLYGLARTLEAADRREEATAAWRRVVAIDPGFRDAARRLSALSGPR